MWSFLFGDFSSLWKQTPRFSTSMKGEDMDIPIQTGGANFKGGGVSFAFAVCLAASFSFSRLLAFPPRVVPHAPHQKLNRAAQCRITTGPAGRPRGGHGRQALTGQALSVNRCGWAENPRPGQPGDHRQAGIPKLTGREEKVRPGQCHFNYLNIIQLFPAPLTYNISTEKAPLDHQPNELLQSRRPTTPACVYT